MRFHHPIYYQKNRKSDLWNSYPILPSMLGYPHDYGNILMVIYHGNSHQWGLVTVPYITIYYHILPYIFHICIYIYMYHVYTYIYISIYTPYNRYISYVYIYIYYPIDGSHNARWLPRGCSDISRRCSSEGASTPSLAASG